MIARTFLVDGCLLMQLLSLIRDDLAKGVAELAQRLKAIRQMETTMSNNIRRPGNTTTIGVKVGTISSCALWLESQGGKSLRYT